MIDIALAQRFIEQVAQYTSYNVNIMDENGIIIASCDPDRVGDYHVVAHQVLLMGKDMMEIHSDQYPGVLKGLNMVIEVDGKREGVVGVTGKPEEIRAAALMTKMSIETMLRYERSQEERRRRENKKEQFIYLLTRVPDADPEEVLSLARELGFPEEAIRVPILVATGGYDPETILQVFRQSPHHTRMDFSFVQDPGHILVYKSLPPMGEGIMRDYKTAIGEYLSPILEQLSGSEGPSLRLYVGSLQDEYRRYCHAYRHVKWLERHLDSSTEKVIFFYDHLNEYLSHLVPMQELDHMFHITASALSPKTRKAITEIILPLHDNNWAFPRTASELYMHKNTLVYRYNQIKELLGLDPLATSSDRTLLVLFSLFLGNLSGH